MSSGSENSERSFTIFWREIYFIMIFIMIVVTIVGSFMDTNYLLIYTLGFFYISSSGSAKHNSLDVSAPGHSP